MEIFTFISYTLVLIGFIHLFNWVFRLIHEETQSEVAPIVVLSIVYGFFIWGSTYGLLYFGDGLIDKLELDTDKNIVSAKFLISFFVMLLHTFTHLMNFAYRKTSSIYLIGDSIMNKILVFLIGNILYSLSVYGIVSGILKWCGDLLI